MNKEDKEITTTLNCVVKTINGLEINSCDVVIGGHQILFEYKSKEFNMMIKGADFGDYWGHGSRYGWKTGGGGIPITVGDKRDNFKSSNQVIDHYAESILRRSPISESHKDKVRQLINQAKTPQLTLF